MDLHESYDNCVCYISTDGLCGFAVEQNGNLVSVFNLKNKDEYRFLRALGNSGFLDECGATHLDGYCSTRQPLDVIYAKTLGWQVAAINEYNMEFDHDDIAENHGNPNIAFMVNVPAGIKIRQEHFGKDDYDAAGAHAIAEVELVNSRVRELGGVFHRGKAPDATQYIVEFADDPNEILSYGEHQYVLLPDQLTDVPDYVKDFSLEYFAEEAGLDPDEMSDEQIETFRNGVVPERIVDSAESWDRSDFVSALWEKFSSEFEELIDNGIVGFKTPDGAVAWPQEKAAYKIADPVTYDDAGNIIPPSQRFNMRKPDPRYSIEPDERELTPISGLKVKESFAQQDREKDSAGNEVLRVHLPEDFDPGKESVLDAMYRCAIENATQLSTIVGETAAGIPGAKALMRPIGKDPNDTYSFGYAVKGSARVIQKAQTDYNGDYQRVVDLTGGTIALPDNANYQDAIDALKRTSEARGAHVAKVKKFRIGEYGYQDIKASIRFANGGIGEVIIVSDHDNYVKLNRGGHIAYEITRILGPKAALDPAIHKCYMEWEIVGKMVYFRSRSALEAFSRAKANASSSLIEVVGLGVPYHWAVSGRKPDDIRIFI